LYTTFFHCFLGVSKNKSSNKQQQQQIPNLYRQHSSEIVRARASRDSYGDMYQVLTANKKHFAAICDGGVSKV
jgi:hypothetical protein